MSARPPSDNPPPGPRRGLIGMLGQATSIIGICALVSAIVPFAGVGVVSLLSQRGSDGTWIRWSNIGETFGAINSILSGLALAALVVTFWVQYREFREQHAELAMQRASVHGAQSELFRSAEANLRKLHIELIKLSLDDEDLAAVWPANPDTPRRRHRQHLYANLIYQHHLLTLRIGEYQAEQVRSSLRHLFTSRPMRAYWRASAPHRTALLPGTQEHEFAQMVDSICQEHESAPAPNHSVSGQHAYTSNTNRPWPTLNRRTQAPMGPRRIRAPRYPVSRRRASRD
jgi:hypothetical protein